MTRFTHASLHMKIWWLVQLLPLLCSAFTLPAARFAPTQNRCEEFKLNAKATATSTSTVSWCSPLLEEGYPPAVSEFKSNTLREKPLLIYLPGYDGTLLAPFLQLPELGTEFDVKGITVSMEDRSSVDELRELVIGFITEEIKVNHSDGDTAKKESLSNAGRPVYIIGESFGGILALEVALAIQEINSNDSSDININLQGITLINPATCYNESNLAKLGPPLTKLSPLLYPFALLKVIPLFTDSFALPQLLLILQSKGLPSVIDNAQREAYMGRVAFSIPNKLKFMPQQTLKWRLEEWLTKGCTALSKRDTCIMKLNVPVLLVAGEVDNTLPSVAEAGRLSRLLQKSTVHVVPGAGHACTSGSRVDLAALMRGAFPNLSADGRTEMKSTASSNSDDYFGLEERYDKAGVGLMPFLYWSEDNYQAM